MIYIQRKCEYTYVPSKQCTLCDLDSPTLHLSPSKFVGLIFVKFYQITSQLILQEDLTSLD